VVLENKEKDGVIELPIYRRVAATMVRVRGLKEFLGASGSIDDDYTIVFATSDKDLQLDGEEGTMSRANNYPAVYKQAGGFRYVEINKREYYEAPKQEDIEKTDYFRVLSHNGGTPVSVSIYYKDQLVSGTPVTQTDDGSPILVKSDLLNVIEIIFSKGVGQNVNLSVRIKEASWNGVIEIEKDFSNGDGW